LGVARSKERERPGTGGLIAAAAYLAHGIARAQAFGDGNHRTGHLVCQWFLDNNGLGELSPISSDDDELAVHLEGTGIKSQPATYGPEDTVDLLRHRQEALDSN
jgi:prophage maintenance system killer protein